MNQIAASIGVAQMEHLPSIIARHQENGLYYDERLAAVPGLTILKRALKSRSAYWVYTFLVRERDHLLKSLRQHGVHASKVHLRNDVYSCFGASTETLPGVDMFSTHCLSIPCGWWVSEDDRARIADIVCQEVL